MQIVRFEARGLYAIMLHNPAGMTRSGSGKLDTKKIPLPDEEARAARYLTEDGKYLRFPLQGFKASFVGGGVGRRIGKRSAVQILKSTLFPAEEWTMLCDTASGAPIPADRFEVDTRRAVVVKQGVLRSRPIVHPWKCLVTFEVDEVIDNYQLLVDIGNLAGRMVGVGDFRPACGGPFGRYQVQLMQ